MSEKPSRFAGMAQLPEDPALRVLGIRSSPKPTEAIPPRTWPGQLADQQAKGLEGRALAAEGKLKKLESAGLVLMRLDPNTIRPSSQANRHEMSLQSTDKDFQDLKKSLRRDGQILPVVVRALQDDPNHAYELVSGHRRHAAAMQLSQEIPAGFELTAVIDAAAQDPAQLALHMYLENAARKDLSAYETGSMFEMWLQAGVCKTQREIASLTALDESTVSQYLTIAGLPPDVLAAFGDPRQISMRWSVALAKAGKEHLPETLARARKIVKLTPRPDAESVYGLLIAGLPATRKSKRGSKKSDRVYVDDKLLFKIALKDSHLTFSRWRVDPELIPALYDDVKSFFDGWLKTHSKPKS
jgi:ParB/RepB/Spo0J family partition protein